MTEERKNYAVYGMKAKCSEGTMENYITTDTGHGVTYQGNPLLNANDHTKQVNLTHFGDCNAKQIYEQAKAQADEKYKAQEGDGLFTLAGKFIAKTVTKDIINRQEFFMFHKCELDTPLPWMFCNDDHMIDGAPALTLESQCTCRFGGIITIVPVEEEPADEESVEAVTEEVTMEPVMAPMEPVAVDDITKTNNKSSSVLGSGGIGIFLKYNDLEESYKAILEAYVNEETLLKINSDWDIEAFKDVYGDNVFEEMRNLMYKYGITSSASILMLFATMGNETGYGKNVIQGTDNYKGIESAKERDKLVKKFEKELETGSDVEEALKKAGVPEISADLGIGLLQVTGIEQRNFIRDLYQSLPSDSAERERIERFFGVTEEYMCSFESWDAPKVDNTAAFIYMYYPIEASMWYWGSTKSKCALFEGSNQTNYTINDYISYFKGIEDTNMNNVFLGIQYTVNSLPKRETSGGRMSKEEVEIMCETSGELADKDTTELIFNGNTYRMPNGWMERRDDWDRVVSEFFPEVKEK